MFRMAHKMLPAAGGELLGFGEGGAVDIDHCSVAIGTNNGRISRRHGFIYLSEGGGITPCAPPLNPG